MRTTITLDPDVALLVEQEMAARKIRFKQAVNDALRRQLAGAAGVTPLVIPARDLGAATADLDRASRLAGELEDEALSRKLAEGR